MSEPSSTPGSEPTEVSVAASVELAADVMPLPPMEAIQELRTGSETAPVVDIDPNAHVRSVSTAPGAPLAAVPGAPDTSDPVTAAAAFVNRYGQGLGLLPGQNAVVSDVDTLPGGDRVVRFQQQVNGVPVMGGDMAVAVNQGGRVVTASAETPDAAPTTTVAAIPAAQAEPAAIAAAAERIGAAPERLTVTKSSLWMYDPRVLGVPGRPELRLTWWVTVGSAEGGTDVASVFVDAVDGRAVFAYSEIETARQRVICDLSNATGLPIEFDPSTYRCTDQPGGPAIVRTEGQGPVPGGVDVNAAYDNLGATYDFYLANFGRDSIDGHGMPLRATVRACHITCPYANAFWDGEQMVFGGGFANADDVVAHELTHGITSHTSDLFYFAESGGINEALSDIMGEFVDQSRGSDDDSQWLLGEDLPIGAIRSMKDPTIYFDPDHTTSQFWSNAINNPADRYGVHSLSGVVNKAAYLLAAGDTFFGITVTGIGWQKSAQIWYRLQYLLPSGAEIRDLVALVPAACRSLIGLAGITLGDCDQAVKAVAATGMNIFGGGFDDKTQKCPTAGMPYQTVFSDDFERGASRWTLPANAMSIPSSQLPVSWASSGKNALYTYTPPGVSSAIAVLDQSITIPPGETPYVYISSNVTTSQGGGQVLVNTGLGWQPVLTSAGFTKGYNGVFAPISALNDVGGTLQIGLLPSTVIVQPGNEWLIDDVRVYLCKSTTPGPPSYIAGQLTNGGASATIVWGPSVYFFGGSGSWWEVSVVPAVPGFTNPTVVAPEQLSLVINGLDPSVRHSFTVTPVQTFGGTARRGPGIMTYLPTDPLFACSIAVDIGGDRGRQTCSSTPQQPPLPR